MKKKDELEVACFNAKNEKPTPWLGSGHENNNTQLAHWQNVNHINTLSRQMLLQLKVLRDNKSRY